MILWPLMSLEVWGIERATPRTLPPPTRVKPFADLGEGAEFLT